jgi:uncharacterized protein (TIGR01777 family)
MIGTALGEMITSQGDKVIILTRKEKAPHGNISYAVWNIDRSVIDHTAISKADHIIHLAGAGVADKRWTKKRKQEIVNSRVNSSRLLVKALREIPNNVRTVVSASGIGWYGPDDKKNKKAFVETDPPHTDFLGQTCVQWEESIQPVKELGKRLVTLRTAIVLSNTGGAFPEFRKPMKAGIAGILGSGKQMVSWIHIDDICRMYLASIENVHMNGAYNAAAPHHVTNKQLVLNIARALKRPFLPLHVPEFALKIALGEMSVEILKSTTVDDSKVRSTGFKFLFPDIESAVNELVRGR